MEEVGNRKETGWQQTAEVLAGNMPVYLRPAGGGQLQLLSCLRFDAAALEATLKWPEDSEDRPPPVAAAVQLYLRAPQFLSITEGEVSRLEEQHPPLVGITCAASSRVYPLRQHPRYLAWGRVRLGEPQEADYFYYDDEMRRLNVSEGGFGLRMPSRGWHLGDSVRFALEARLSEDPVEAARWPELKLRGTALLRSRAAQPDGANQEHFGFAFTQLADYQRDVLKLWLTAIHVYRRQ